MCKIGKGFLFFNMAFGWPTAKNKFFNPTMSDLMYPTMFAIMAKDSNFSNFDGSDTMTHETLMTHKL